MYERYIVSTLSAALAQDLVTRAVLKPGERILDVACGTGAVTRYAAQAVGVAGAVTGLDINDGMLRMAHARSSPDGASISYREGSAMAIPFPEAAFDAVFCQHGLEFFPDRGQGLREMRRVLRPQGRLGLRVWRAIEYQAFHMAVLAVLKRYLWGNQEVQGRTVFAQPFSLWCEEELHALVTDAGFRDIEVRGSKIPIRLGANPTDMLGYLTALPIWAEIAAMEEHTRNAMIHDAIAALQPFADAGGLVIPAESHVVLARS
jgi:ubiquinone/menaquinone biosynthesis C-methylase UbiE